MSLKRKTIMFFATGGFIGDIPFAPGTFGSIIGLFFCFYLSKTDWIIESVCLVLFTLFAIWMAHEAEKQLGKTDPGCVVIDEIAGMIVTLAFLPFTVVSAAAGFFIFRFFDILKPFPIRQMEKKIPGGAGIVLDDILAGIYSHIVLRVIFIWIPYDLL